MMPLTSTTLEPIGFVRSTGVGRYRTLGPKGTSMGTPRR